MATKKQREILAVSDMATNAKYPGDKTLHPDDWDQYTVVQDTEEDFDAEKGFIDHKIVVKRKLDGRFFQFTYTQFGHNGDNMMEQTAEEVFEKTKTITTYG